MFADLQLAMFDGVPASPHPRRHRCPTCHAGFAPVGRSQRIADQRAAADRDYADAWAEIVATRPDAVARVVGEAIEHCARVKRPSIDAVWLAIRGNVPREVSNNNLRGAAARWLMANVPGLAGKFTVRSTAGDPERAAR